MQYISTSFYFDKILLIFALCILFSLLPGSVTAEEQSTDSNTIHYSKNNLDFYYPTFWKISGDEYITPNEEYIQIITFSDEFGIVASIWTLKTDKNLQSALDDKLLDRITNKGYTKSDYEEPEVQSETINGFMAVRIEYFPNDKFIPYILGYGIDSGDGTVQLILNHNDDPTTTNIKTFEKFAQSFSTLGINKNSLSSSQEKGDAKEWYNKGLSLDELGKFEEAIEAYDKALKIDPNYSLAKENRDVSVKALNTVTPTEKLSITSDKDTIQAGESITTTISDDQKLNCIMWLSDISSMNPYSGEYPPTLKENQDGVETDIETGPYVIGVEVGDYSDAELIRDIIPDDEKYHGTRYYAKVFFDDDGKRDVTWVTTKETKPGTYTIKVQDGDESDELTFTVKGSESTNPNAVNSFPSSPDSQNSRGEEEQSTDSNTIHYSKNNLDFYYPTNWELWEDDIQLYKKGAPLRKFFFVYSETENISAIVYTESSDEGVEKVLEDNLQNDILFRDQIEDYSEPEIKKMKINGLPAIREEYKPNDLNKEYKLGYGIDSGEGIIHYITIYNFYNPTRDEIQQFDDFVQSFRAFGTEESSNIKIPTDTPSIT